MSSISLAPAALAGLVGLTLVAGGLIGAAITSPIRSAETNQVTISAAGRPAATFDAVEFRAGERGTLVANPTFDAVEFRAEERGILVANAIRVSSSIAAPPGSAAANSPRIPPKTFDAVEFRAEERGAFGR